MKRLLCFLLSATCVFPLLTSCGNDTADRTEEDTSSAVLEEQADDTMHLNMLFSLINTPDIGVTELLGDGNQQKYNAQGNISRRTFSGTAFGMDLTFDVCYNDYSDVSSIEVDFPEDADEEQLTATLTHLIGKEPSDHGTWHTESASVSLENTDDCYRVILTAHTGEPNHE